MKFQEEQENSQSSESYTEHQSAAPDEPAKTVILTNYHSNVASWQFGYLEPSLVRFKLPFVLLQDEVDDPVPRDLPPVQSEQQDLGEGDMVDQVHADSVPKDQQAIGGGSRRPYPNGRGGGRGGGGRRPYPNGRSGGGRGNGVRGGGSGGYSNGGRGYYHDSNYQPRGYYNNRGRGGGGRSGGGGGGGSMYNSRGGSNGGQAAPS